MLEATGGYERLLVAALHAGAIPVAVVNPRRVRDFARAAGRLAKTDALDARVLAKFGEAIQPRLQEVQSAEQRDIEALVVRYGQLREMLTGEQAQSHQVPSNSAAGRSIQVVIGFLKSEIAKIESDFDKRVEGSKRWTAQRELLTSVPGVGDKTSI